MSFRVDGDYLRYNSNCTPLDDRFKELTERYQEFCFLGGDAEEIKVPRNELDQFVLKHREYLDSAKEVLSHVNKIKLYYIEFNRMCNPHRKPSNEAGTLSYFGEEFSVKEIEPNLNTRLATAVVLNKLGLNKKQIPS